MLTKGKRLWMQFQGEVRNWSHKQSDHDPDGGHLGESGSVPVLNIVVRRTESYYLSHRTSQTG